MNKKVLEALKSRFGHDALTITRSDDNQIMMSFTDDEYNALRAYFTDPGYQVVPVRNVRKVKRYGDQSLVIEFPSCRSASEFEQAMLEGGNSHG